MTWASRSWKTGSTSDSLKQGTTTEICMGARPGTSLSAAAFRASPSLSRRVTDTARYGQRCGPGPCLSTSAEASALLNLHELPDLTFPRWLSHPPKSNGMVSRTIRSGNTKRAVPASIYATCGSAPPPSWFLGHFATLRKRSAHRNRIRDGMRCQVRVAVIVYSTETSPCGSPKRPSRSRPPHWIGRLFLQPTPLASRPRGSTFSRFYAMIAMPFRSELLRGGRIARRTGSP